MLAPYAETEFLRAFIYLTPDSPALFTARGLFTVVKESTLCADLDSLAETIVSGTAGYRDRTVTER